ncbi:MAG: N-acetylmuramoyl-L-alanine amidase [Lamprobacter sp.]|uniref:N-acetylmuramoyl-L-alanine amidase n=1 Tax=Lamprobacter sp. TaxID=3100796 RepID=UPI002B262364|nr:N-acetylmuramoyl-L-alanine amidase [Lamprobacter sp.]MEA3638593.1 N-acetylmuramoyl-L-alanine amidase [Lamprobacter sp.]
MLFLSFAGLASAAQVGVDGARMWTGPEYTRFVVDVAAPVGHRVFALDNPHRLVIDLIDARLKGKLPEPAADDPVVANLRSGIREGDDLRIVLDLKQEVRAKSFNLGPSGSHGHRLVIDLSPKAGSAVASKKALSRSSTSAKAAAEAMAAPEAASITPGGGHLSIRSQRPANRDLIVAVDAGHGGKDPGAIGGGGTHEKDITLAISRKLAQRINAHPGMRAVMVRDGDYYLHLRKRIEIAREHRADLFVSIHADAFKDPRVRGSSVFTLSAGGATSEAARWIAERENRADLIGGVDLKQRDDLLASVLLEMSQNATIELSGIAATKVLAKLQRLGEVHQQHIQQAGFAVLKSPDIPSMLVETAFISNPDEEKRLNNPSYQNKLADAIRDGIIEYFAEYPPPGTRFATASAPATALAKATTSAARQHRIQSGETLSEIASSYNVRLSVLRDINQLQGDQIRAGQVLLIPGS